MKRILSILICISMLSAAVLPGFALSDEGSFTWEDRTTNKSYRILDTEWKFRPFENYACEQNPPSFSWPVSTNAQGYDLIVATDPEMENIAYEKRGLTVNYYNFPHVFEAGKTYWWSVRYHTDSGVSKWREPSKFWILPECYPFPLPDLNKLMDEVGKKGHPRIGITKATLAEDRAIKDKYPESKKVFDTAYKLSEAYLANEIYGENKPTTASAAAYDTAFIYAITGEKRFGEFAKKQVLEIASWDVNGKTAYKNGDTMFRQLMYDTALVYDYIYDLLTPEERVKILESVKQRMIVLENPSGGLSDSIARLCDSPYLSHGWTALTMLLVACLATAGDLPVANELFAEWMPLFVNLESPHSYEDGNYSGGMAYWSYVGNMFLAYTLDKLTGFSTADKAFRANSWKVPVYQMSANTECEFGDESYGAKPDGNDALAIKAIAYTAGAPYAKWKYEKLALSGTNTYMLYFINALWSEIEAKAPLSEPRSTVFKDVGVVAMHSDLINDNDKVSAYFRSSPYGSFNHAHPDQNSFHIQAFGERLAIDSGYYDGYGYPFDMGYTKKTYAHNAITYDGGKGVAPASANSPGDIVNFITHPDFDLATGDATAAYNVEFDYQWGGARPYKKEPIDKVKRHFIYLRPDTFLVIDDLQAANGDQVNFEWWLNAFEDISLYNERDGARITKGNAVLDAKVHYPKVTGYYLDIFSGPDKVDKAPLMKRFQTSQVHKRVWFETPKTNKTKMIATMDVRRSSDGAPYVKSEEKEGYVYFSFEDGTKAYVATGDEPMDTGRFQTDAAAIVIKDHSIMVVDATSVIMDGEKFLTSDEKISVAYGKNEINVSADKAFKAEIKTDEIRRLRTYHEIEEAPNQSSRGFNWSWNNGYLKVDGYNGYYSYLINDKPAPGAVAEDYTLRYSISDQEKEATLSGYMDIDGKKMLNGNIENSAGFYKVEDINNVSLKGVKKGDVVLFENNEAITSTGENAVLKLTALSDKIYAAEANPDYDSVKAQAAAFVEAENYFDKTSGATVYTTRKFLSGGAGYSGFNAFGTTTTWEFDVPAEGKYNLVVKYAGWSGLGGVTQSLVEANGVMGTVNFPETGSYGAVEAEWTATTVKTEWALKKGKTRITLYPIFGSWNMDWLALVKAE